MQKSMNSRRKGKVGEREFAALLREHGFDARRGQQFAGGTDSPDVVSDALAWLHVEVKRVQNLNLTDACVQAEGDCQGKRWKHWRGRSRSSGASASSKSGRRSGQPETSVSLP